MALSVTFCLDVCPDRAPVRCQPRSIALTRYYTDDNRGDLDTRLPFTLTP